MVGNCGNENGLLSMDADKVYLSLLEPSKTSTQSPSVSTTPSGTPASTPSSTPLSTPSSTGSSTRIVSSSTTESASSSSSATQEADPPGNGGADTPSSSATPTRSINASFSTTASFASTTTPDATTTNTRTTTPTSTPTASLNPSEPDASVSPTPTPTASQNPSDPDACDDPNYSDPAGIDIVPSSASVSDTWVNPGIDWDLQNEDYWFTRNWGNAPTLDEYEGSLRLTTVYYGPSDIYLLTNETVEITPNREFNFSFDIWQNDTNIFQNLAGDTSTFQFNISISILDSIPPDESMWSWINYIDDGECGYGYCKVFAHEQILSLETIPTTKQTALNIPLSFTSNPNYIGPGSIIISIKQPNSPVQPAGNNYFIDNLFFEKTDQQRSFLASPYVISSPYVDVPFAPEIPIQSQTNCPHLKSGLSNWHDPSIWPGSKVPEANQEDITIPNGLSVLISSCSIDSNGIYGSIYVPTGTELIFADSNINMTVGNIHINGGHLWIGSETCRMNSNILITLDDSAKTISTHMGRKGITSTGEGKIDIHGKLFQKTWTRIASPANVGDDRVLIMEDVNWEVGQQIALITTIWEDHLNNQNEVLTIKAIDGRKIQFEETLQFYHHAGEEYQAEIVLLSRRIKIQGDEISENTNFGGHILSNGEIGRFSGVQAFRMGQTNVIARYPFHFHLMNDSPESYFQDCSVYKSFYRCFTIHGTNSTMISRNTAFDIQAHCFYIEDGVEEHNTFEFNFAGYIKPLKEIDFYEQGYGQDGVTIYQEADLLIPADGAVSGFYISNANNNFTGNAASGGFAGFSFINFPHAIGSHRSLPIVPQERPLGRFYGNTAHSSSYQWNRGGCIYTGGNQEYDDNDELWYNVGRKERNTKSEDGSTPEWMIFYETRVYLCNRGLNHWGDRAETIGYAAHDITKGLTLFGEAYVHRAIIDGESSNPLENRPNPTRAFEYYDTHVKTILDDVTFMNLKETPTKPVENAEYGIVSMTHSDVFKPQGINAANKLKWINIFENGRIGNKIRDTGASRFYNIMDFDGSILDTNKKTIIGSANVQNYTFGSDPDQVIKEWWNIHPSCIEYPEYVIYACDKQDDLEIVNIQLDVNDLTASTVSGVNWPHQSPTSYVGTISHFGYSGDDRRSGIITANPGITGISGDTGMYAFFDNGTPKEFFIRCKQIPVVDGNPTHIIMAFKYPRGITFDIRTQHLWKHNQFSQNCTEASTFNEMYNNVDGTQYFLQDSSDGEQWLFLKLIYRHFDSNTPESSGYFERNGIRLYDVTVFYSYRVATCDSQCPFYDLPSTSEPIYTGAVPTWDVNDLVPDFVSNLL